MIDIKYRILLTFISSLIGGLGIPFLGNSLILPILSLIGVFLSFYGVKKIKDFIIINFFPGIGINLGIHFYQVYSLDGFFGFSPLVTIPLVSFINSFINFNLSLFLILFFVFHKKLNLTNTLLISVAYPISRSLTPLFFDDQIGLAINNYQSLVLTTQYIGYSFYSFLILLTSLGFLKLILNNKINKELVIASILWSFAFLTGHFLSFKEISKDTIPVAIIQPNLHHKEREFARTNLEAGIEAIEIQKELTIEALSKNPNISLVLWPETTYPFIFNQEQSIKEEMIRNDLINFLKEKNITLLIGAFRKNQEVIENSILVINHFNGKTTLDFLSKKELLPVGEFVPLKNYIPLLNNLFKNSMDLQSNNKITTIIQTDKGLVKIGSAICYEIFLPRHTSELSKNDVDLILNPSTESWFGWGGWQTSLGYSISKSLNLNIPIVRSTNTGFSAIVDGKNYEYLDINTKGFIIKDVPLKNKKTFYNEYGDLFIIISCLYLIIVGGRKWLF